MNPAAVTLAGGAEEAPGITRSTRREDGERFRDDRGRRARARTREPRARAPSFSVERCYITFSFSRFSRSFFFSSVLILCLTLLKKNYCADNMLGR